MKVRIKGADLIRFYREWPPGDDVAIDDPCYSEDGEDGVLRDIGALPWDEDDYEKAPAVEPDKTYTVEHGTLLWQGSGAAPANMDESFARVVKRWLKAQKATTLVVEVPNEDAEACRAMCAERGWRVS
jgi:hypothetical protein